MKEAEREARRWYLQAVDDRLFAEWILSENRFFDKGCFIAQQAGEKALKACLYAGGSRRVIGHSLVELCVELREAYPSAASMLESAKRLDRHYIPTRYPNGLPGGTPFQSYSRGDLERAIEDLAAVFEGCKSRLFALGVLEDPSPTG